MQNKLKQLLLLLLLSQATAACSANLVKAEWKADCVGRMQISFPTDVEVATNPEGYFKYRLVSTDFLSREYEFADGEGAGWSFFGITISSPLDEISKNRIEKYFDDGYQRRLQERETLTELEKKYELEKLNLGVPFTRALRVDDHISILLSINNRIILTSISGASGARVSEPSEMVKLIAENIKKAKLEANLYTSRELYEIPKELGVCLPYMFLKKGAKESHKIAMTYRLKSHPDITVWLEDSDAVSFDLSTEEGKHYDKKREPASRINDFWGQYESPEETQVDTIWDFPKHLKTVKLDGREGKASFVEITHLEKPVKTYFGGSKSQYRPKTIDYGYLAVVRGDPKAKTDTPDLRFYVIRNAETAIKQGIKPLEKDEFLKLAEEIAATVKRRPIQ